MALSMVQQSRRLMAMCAAGASPGIIAGVPLAQLELKLKNEGGFGHQMIKLLGTRHIGVEAWGAESRRPRRARAP